MDNNNTEKDFSTFVFDSESADGEVTEIRDVQSAGETFQFSDISEVDTVSVSGSDAFPTGELENAGAVFAGAIGEDFTDPTEDDADPAADSETAVESAAVIFHASDAHREKKARKGNDQGWLAGMTGRNGGFDWRKPIAALILLAMCGVALFYYGGVVKASTADPRLSATSFLTDLTSYHKAEVVDAAPAPVIASGREVIIVGTSVEEDMSIRVEDENGERVTGIAFEFAVTSPDEDVQYYTDDDMDGTMYIDGIPEGTYSVELLEIAGYKAENIEVEVLPKVARQMIENISEKIVDSSEIVASQDDPNYGGTTGAGADPGVSSDVGNTVPHVDTDEKEEERVVTTVKYTCEVEKDTGRLLKKDGTPSDYVPEIDKDGYMTGYYRVYKAPPAPSEDGYAFRWSAGEGGKISVVTCSSGALNSGDKVPEGADITIVAEANKGYRFTAWTITEGTISGSHTDPALSFKMPGTSVTVQAVFEKIQESSTPESSEPESSTPESSEPESSTPAESESSDITESSETPGGGDENSNIPDSSETPEVPDNPPAEGGSDGGSSGEEGFIGTGGNDYPESFGDLSNYTADYRVTAVEIKDTESVTVYYGWHDQDGKTYYYDQNGNKVTGQQVIDGITYYFDSEGALQKNASQTVGIDVSTWQNSIDWDRVKASGISFVIIRCGFRGYGSGKIVEDDMFRANIAGAKAAGLKVGVYFFSQAINTAEAVEEASACISLVRSSGYSIELPIVIDVEYAAPSARTNSLSRSDLTKICVAFCDTCRSSGYSAMVYANKYYLEWKLYPSEFSNYYIWLAHYTGGSISSYSGRYNMWQYTSVGTVDGVQGGVDMNYSYVW